MTNAYIPRHAAVPKPKPRRRRNPLLRWFAGAVLAVSGLLVGVTTAAVMVS